MRVKTNVEVCRPFTFNVSPAKHYTYKIDSPIHGHKPSILFPNTSTDDDNYYRMEPKSNSDHYGLIPSDTRFAGYVWPGKFSTHKKLCLQYCHGSSSSFGLLLVDLPGFCLRSGCNTIQHHKFSCMLEQ
jgi:hypothetical protein